MNGPKATSALSPIEHRLRTLAGAAYRAVMGRHFPAMALVEVKGLVAREARLEIEATAVVPDRGANA